MTVVEHALFKVHWTRSLFVEESKEVRHALQELERVYLFYKPTGALRKRCEQELYP